MSEYDRQHVADILLGEGTWYNARLLRALADLLPHADVDNAAILERTWPEQCDAIRAWANS